MPACVINATATVTMIWQTHKHPLSLSAKNASNFQLYTKAAAYIRNCLKRLFDCITFSLNTGLAPLPLPDRGHRYICSSHV